MDQAGVRGPGESHPDAPADQEGATCRQPPLQGGPDQERQHRDQRHEEPGRGVPSAPPHVPRSGGQENRSDKRQGDQGLTPIFSPMLDKTGKGQGEDGGIDQHSELLIEQETRQASWPF